MVYSIKMVEPSLVLLDEERAEILGPFTHVKETGLPPVSMSHKTYTFGQIDEVKANQTLDVLLGRIRSLAFCCGNL